MLVRSSINIDLVSLYVYEFSESSDHCLYLLPLMRPTAAAYDDHVRYCYYALDAAADEELDELEGGCANVPAVLVVALVVVVVLLLAGAPAAAAAAANEDDVTVGY